MNKYTILLIVIALIAPGFFLFPVGLWFRALFSGALINPVWLFRMWVQHVNPKEVIEPLIIAAQAGLDISTAEIVSYLLTKGRDKKPAEDSESSAERKLVEELIQCLVKLKKVGISLTFDDVGQMDLAGAHVPKIVDAFIKAQTGGVQNVISSDEDKKDKKRFTKLAGVDLAGGDIDNVVRALITSVKARLGLDFDKIATIELSGINSLAAVQDYVNPKVIQTQPIRAVAQDGIELITSARITIRTNFDRIVGGAVETTIIAMVSEGINREVASSETHKVAQSQPDVISQKIFDTINTPETLKKLSYDIVSIDIVDIDVGRSIGQNQKIERAKAEIEDARAKAERAKQTILEQRAALMAAEAEVPRAVANAIAGGKMTLVDYYKMKNIKADILMRNAIASVNKNGEDDEKR